MTAKLIEFPETRAPRDDAAPDEVLLLDNEELRLLMTGQVLYKLAGCGIIVLRKQGMGRSRGD